MIGVDVQMLSVFSLEVRAMDCTLMQEPFLGGRGTLYPALSR